MIRKVQTKKDLMKFIFFIEDLYKNHEHYVFPIFYSLKKELKREILEQSNYTALLAIKNNKVVGRIMYTVDYSKKQSKDICYFSFFDAENDQKIVNELFEYMEDDMKKKGIDYLEGTFSPYDPDTRRGVLVKGFDSPPVIFTSYNYEYYGALLEGVGCYKAIDTVSLNADANEKSMKRLNTISRFFTRSHDVRVDSLTFKNLESDMDDVYEILKEATNEIVYQDAPSMDLVRNAAEQLKLFINPNLIRIARENKTNKPIGFCLVLPDYNQVFKKTKGRIRPLRILLARRKMNKARGMMQYVIPEYQGTGLIAHMFKVIFEEFNKIGITDFEAGTMMEDNPRPINTFKKFGGEIIKIYRLYGKDF